MSSLYAAVGENQISAQHVVQRLVEALGGAEGAEEDLAETAAADPASAAPRPAGDPGVVVKGDSDVWVSCRAAAPRCPATRSSGS